MTPESEIQELTADVSDSAYWSRDMAPVGVTGRKWGTWDIAALWISMAACIPTYTMASSLIKFGMSWWQAVLTIFLGNLIVLVPMILNAHAGTKYGIPFPVYCRAAFGLRGANVPAMLRALVACGWFGIQTWIGGSAIYTILVIYVPDLQTMPKDLLGINLVQLGCFLLFWSVNVAVVSLGIESIRWLLNIKAPLLIALGLLLLFWAVWMANGFGPILSQPSQFGPGGKLEGQFWKFFVPGLTANVGFWATLSLNIPDFSRYARRQRDQVWGQALGLPATMALYSFIGVAVTSATLVLYGEAIWDPVQLLTKVENPWLHIAALLALSLATLATNIAANVVGPANDFANLAPRWISFRMGALMTGLIGILMCPWLLYSGPDSYIFKWLVAYSALLGAVGGVLLADYYLVRRTRLDLTGLYQKVGPYWYEGGVNWIAMLSLVLGIAPCVPGFLAAVELVAVDPFWTELYHYAWFVSFGISAVCYRLMTRIGIDFRSK